MNTSYKIAIIGLGYVGLPLASLFATKYPVIGYDINAARIEDLKKGIDTTNEVDVEELNKVLNNDLDVLATAANGLYFTNEPQDIQAANVYIVTVPTPVDKNNRPDLIFLEKASELVGKFLTAGDIVIYESTVYPGVTEEECVPVLEKNSGLLFNQDFYVGYSPERINPGDKTRKLADILKVTSGSTPEVGLKIDALYATVIKAGTHLAPTIKVAEAAKVIENSQRDINIAFVNELAKIFSLMQIDTQDVLAAASTKWNFLPFKPGLVGGHCIGVDPFYLAQKAQEFGYYSELILTARRMNDSMANFIGSEIIKLMIKNDLTVKKSKVLQLGITFKENCPDIRNSKATEVTRALAEYGINVVVYDPWANVQEVLEAYQITSISQADAVFNLAKQINGFDVIVLTVAHDMFVDFDLDGLLATNGLIYDVKGVLPKQIISGRL